MCIYAFASTQDGTFNISLVHQTVQCRALPFRPTLVEPLVEQNGFAEEAAEIVDDSAVDFPEKVELDQLPKEQFGSDIAIAFSGAEDVALIEGQANGNGAANPNGSAIADSSTSKEDIKEGRGKSTRERDKVQSSRDRDRLRSCRAETN